MSDAVLAARDLTVRRDGDMVLDSLSLDVPPESELLIRGASGSGKTTLFNVLGLLEWPTSGTVVVDGQPASDLSERKRSRVRRDHVGIIFQDFQLVPDLTVRENARLPQEHAGTRDDEWLDVLFDRLELSHLGDRYPPKLSGGERQRVAIARALANHPAVVLADEPTGQLDPETADRVLELLFEVRAESGTALVVVSHDTSIGDRFDDRVELVDGSLQ